MNPSTLKLSENPLFALFQKAPSQARLDELCEFPPVKGEQEELVFWFTQLVAWMRPRGGQKATTKVRFLEMHIAQRPEWRANMSEALGKLVENTDVDRLLAYGGIPTDFHFGGAVRDWIVAWSLPSACRTSDGGQIAGLAFRKEDLEWLGRPQIVGFFRGLLPPAVRGTLDKALSSALIELAHQVVAQAHSPSVRTLALSDRSPFQGLHESVLHLTSDPSPSHASAVLGRVRQCNLLLASHRSELMERGANLNTTFQLARLKQQLARLGELAKVFQDSSDASIGQVAARIVDAVIKGSSGRRLFRRSSDLLVQNLVDTAATVGRGYLDDEHSSWRAAFLAGAGGGAIMALATLVKYFLTSLHLPSLYEGIVYSINYSAAFCAAYLLHFTIATKLPAHTAAALARSVQSEGSLSSRLRLFSGVWKSMLRLQIAGLLGNVLIAGPLAYALNVGAFLGLGHHLLAPETAEHILTSNSLLGPSALYATLTGFFLWGSSLIGASGNNWTRVIGLTDRIATSRTVMRRINPHYARKYAEAFVSRAGGLIGNISLGVMLGLIPALFAIARLPVEIRHVTVSTAALCLAVAQGAGSTSEIVFAAVGVLVIGIVNVSVSFVLALWLALRTNQGMRASPHSRALAWIGLRRWLKGHADKSGRERADSSPVISATREAGPA